MESIHNIIESFITESSKVSYKGHNFALKVDVNEDPKKKGIKIQFVPIKFGQLSPNDQNDLAIGLESKLDDGLQEFGLKVERDRELKDPSIIGFFLYIEYVDKLVRNVLKSGSNVDR